MRSDNAERGITKITHGGAFSQELGAVIDTQQAGTDEIGKELAHNGACAAWKHRAAEQIVCGWFF
jgi:hypothetical protein